MVDQPPGGTPHSQAELAALEAKINALLPPQYQDCYDAVSPQSMGSTGLKFGPDGKVAWGEMWSSFCDLALAGGPAHRGTLLEPVTAEEARAEPENYRAVVEEITRGVGLVTELAVVPSPTPGWVGVWCRDEAMAVWLLRAVMVENVFARRAHNVLYLPAGPHFRLHKEVKNVVTALAKTYHYCVYHLPTRPRLPVAELVGPATPAEARAEPDNYQAAVEEIERGVRRSTGLPTTASRSLGWVGVPCADEGMAVWLMRAMLVEDVVVRREGEVLYLPAGPDYVATGKARRVVAVLACACHYWDAHRRAGEAPPPEKG